MENVCFSNPSRMAKSSLKQIRHDATYEALLDAAELVMRRRGFAKTTMRDIAAEAGCSSATIYQYFSDKQKLLAATFDRNFRALLDVLQEKIQSVSDPVQLLREDAYCVIQHLSRNRDLERLLRAKGQDGRGPVEHLPAETKKRFRHVDAEMTEAIRRGQGQGRIRRDIPAELLRALFRRQIVGTFDVLSQDGPVDDQKFEVAWRFIAGALGITESST